MLSARDSYRICTPCGYFYSLSFRKIPQSGLAKVSHTFSPASAVLRRRKAPQNMPPARTATRKQSSLAYTVFCHHGLLSNICIFMHMCAKYPRPRLGYAVLLEVALHMPPARTTKKQCEGTVFLNAVRPEGLDSSRICTPCGYLRSLIGRKISHKGFEPFWSGIH